MTTATSHSTQTLQQKRNARSGSGLTMDAITLEVTDGAATRRILNEVSLHIAPGELVGITGPSGSGKSTLLSVAGCLQEPTSGEAVLTAADSGGTLRLTGHSAREAARIRRSHIGIVFQQPNLLPSLRVKISSWPYCTWAPRGHCSARPSKLPPSALTSCWMPWAWVASSNARSANSPGVSRPGSTSPVHS